MTGIVERMDSLSITRLHVFAGLVCAFALGADLMDMSIGSALTAVFSATPHPMDPKRLGWLISSVYVGAVLGGPALGWVADRRGFKRVTVAALSWVGLTSMLAASSDNTIWLSVVRLLSGLALGAIPPLIIAYLTAIAPSRVRGLYIFWICAISFLAAPAPIFMIRWLTPLQPLGIDAWRWPFAVAGLLSFGASAAFVRLPESPRWLLNQHRFAQAASVCEKLERSPPVWGRRTESCEKGPDGARELTVTSQPLPSRLRLMGGFKARFAFLVALYFLHPWATLGFSLLTGPILLARGYDLKDTLLFVGMATFGPSLSTWIAGLLIDRLQRSTALALSGVLMLAAAIVFFTLPTAGWITIAVVAFGIGSGFYVPLMSTYGAEIFITGAQASATASAWAINRIGAVAVPIVLLPLLQERGAGSVALCIYLALGLSILLVSVLGPRSPAAPIR